MDVFRSIIFCCSSAFRPLKTEILLILEVNSWPNKSPVLAEPFSFSRSFRMKFETNIQGMKDTLEYYKREWTKKNLEVEIKIAEGGRITFSTEERQIKEYSLSSTNRRRFLMYIIRATYEDTSLTVS